MIPEGTNSVGELRGFVLDAHGLSTNTPRISNAGDGVHIGIIDSTEYPENLANPEKLSIVNQESFVDSAEKETLQHGTKVLRIASHYSPRSEYSLYQAVDSDRTLKTRPFDEAVDAAIRDGVDILNISAGDP